MSQKTGRKPRTGIVTALRERTFRSMSERNYRLYTYGNMVSVIGTWMQRVAQDWLVYVLTESPVALGISLALQFAPTLLLGLWGGVYVDRRDRWRIVVITQVAAGVLAAILGVLSMLGVVQLWMVYVLTVALGVVTVFEIPARQALVGEMVGKENYVNAQSLNSSVNNAGRLVGPAIAGLVIAGVGIGVAFLINAVSFVAVIIGMARMDRSKLMTVPPVARGPGQVREGLAYVAGNRMLLQIMILVFVVATFGQNFRIVLPVLASDTFHADAAVYGYLMAFLGVGAIIGSLVTASRHTASGWAVLLSCLGFGIANLAAAASPNLWVAYGMMVVLGYASISFNSLARTVLQVNSDQSMHGRVMALHAMVFLGTTPLGGPLIGWLCEVLGPRSGLAVAGVTAVLAALILLPAARRLRRSNEAEVEVTEPGQ